MKTVPVEFLIASCRMPSQPTGLLQTALQAKHSPLRQRWFSPHSAEFEHGAQVSDLQIGLGFWQGPQVIKSPQGLSMLPQKSSEQCGGVQPQTFGFGDVPPPQISGVEQSPQ